MALTSLKTFTAKFELNGEYKGCVRSFSQVVSTIYHLQIFITIISHHCASDMSFQPEPGLEAESGELMSHAWSYSLQPFYCILYVSVTVTVRYLYLSIRSWSFLFFNISLLRICLFYLLLLDTLRISTLCPLSPSVLTFLPFIPQCYFLSYKTMSRSYSNPSEFYSD